MITLEWYLTSLVMTAFVSMLTTVDDIPSCGKSAFSRRMRIESDLL